jgi:hypothetical protein
MCGEIDQIGVICGRYDSIGGKRRKVPGSTGRCPSVQGAVIPMKSVRCGSSIGPPRDGGVPPAFPPVDFVPALQGEP